MTRPIKPIEELIIDAEYVRRNNENDHLLERDLGNLGADSLVSFYKPSDDDLQGCYTHILETVAFYAPGNYAIWFDSEYDHSRFCILVANQLYPKDMIGSTFYVPRTIRYGGQIKMKETTSQASFVEQRADS